MSNLGTLRNNVRLLADVDTTDVSDAEINRFVQNAYEEVLADDQWPFLMARATFSTVVAQAEYASAAIASDVEAHRITQVMAQGVVLAYLPPEQYFKLAPYGQTTASSSTTPSYWTVLQVEKLALWPTPQSIYSVQVVYATVPASLSGDTDTPLLPSRYHHHLEAGALVWVYQKIGDFEAADVKKKEFADGVNNMRDDLLRAQRQTPMVYGGQQERPTLLYRPPMPWEQ